MSIPQVKVMPDATPSTIETVHANKDLKDVVNLASFMEELMTIEVAASQSENEPNHTILNVNGTNQPIFFGYPQTIRRKYVEVLARMKQTRYSQDPTDYINPERSNALRPRTSLVYPFQVLEDKHPKGNAWLRAILSEHA